MLEAPGAQPAGAVQALLAGVTAWARAAPPVVAVLLVGSRARGTARANSDVDFVILTPSPRALLDNDEWLRRFGILERHRVERHGRLTSLRAFYRGGLEVEFGLTTPDWAEPPFDPGTERVLRDGYRVLFGPWRRLSGV
ncbi:MAG: nucleotidyltransferase domain-containing protein [Acidobacteriota bacterium]